MEEYPTASGPADYVLFRTGSPLASLCRIKGTNTMAFGRTLIRPIALEEEVDVVFVTPPGPVVGRSGGRAWPPRDRGLI